MSVSRMRGASLQGCLHDSHKKAMWPAVVLAALCLLPAALCGQTEHSRHHHPVRHAAHPVRHAVHRRVTRRRYRRPVHPHRLTASELARSRRLHTAFVASAQLRPMAQQLVQLRTPQAYAAVLAWAHRHQGEAAATAYLALGHAYLLDGNDREAPWPRL